MSLGSVARVGVASPRLEVLIFSSNWESERLDPVKDNVASGIRERKCQSGRVLVSMVMEISENL